MALENNMEYIQIEPAGPVTTITINRPEVLNALNPVVLDELASAFEQIDTGQVRVVILTGAGDKAFVAGADIQAFASLDQAGALDFARRGQALTVKIERFPRPVIAAVNGFALGGGCELALACHLRVASEQARFGQPEVSLGVMAGFGGTQRLPRLVGKGVALELLTTGRMIDATEALRIGLVNRVVPPDRLLPVCREIAALIVAQGPKAVELTIKAVNEGLDRDLASALELEARLFAATFNTADMREGTQAFIEKRKPDFKGQ
jgi:enoyl-CoA hydratase